jgi:uncharacterized protein YegL
MRRKLSIIFISAFYLFSFHASGQENLPGNISLNKQTHNFGDIQEGNPRIADFILTNNGSDDVFMLRAEVPDNCIYRYSTQKILPGQSATLRIKYNPDQKGIFQEDILVYTSASGLPFKLSITGNVRFVDKSDDYSCPDFNEPAEEKNVKRDFTVQVIDKATMLPIQNSKVSFEPNPTMIPIHLTNKEGIIKVTLPVDLYDINVEADGYEPAGQTLYVGKNVTSTVFLLVKVPHPTDSIIFTQHDEKEPDPEFDTTAIHENPRKPDTTITNIIHKIDRAIKPKPKPPVIPPQGGSDTLVVKENPGELPVSKYAANNIVFLLDISSSMATPERLPLVKIAMKKLLFSLRSIDKVSIVTYASGTKLLLEPTSADNKEYIASKIDALVARGTTEGGKGIREAYKVAAENFIKGGNNQIILATDGDFNLDRSDDALYRFIKHKAQEGISISVVGVGNIPRALKKMQDIVDKGQGNFIHITGKDQAGSVLIDEIKARSLKK